MISAFGIDHGEVVSKLSGYDYHKGGQHHVATRVGWSEQDTPTREAASAAKYAGKRAGRVKVLQPSTYKKANRKKKAGAAHAAALERFKATRGGPATPGKYTQQVWEHENTVTGKKHYTAGMIADTPFKGPYKTWQKKDRNKAKPAMAKRY